MDDPLAHWKANVFNGAPVAESAPGFGEGGGTPSRVAPGPYPAGDGETSPATGQSRN